MLLLSHLAVLLLARLEPYGLFARMADSALVNGASANIYSTVILHFGVGTFLAILYAKYWEPRIAGSALQKGLSFSLIPWLGTCVFLFPLSGAGMFASGLRAGAIPVLGSLFLHLIYGLVLSVTYQPGAYNLSVPSPLTVEEERRQAERQARGGAIGLLGGTIIGSLIGIVATLTLGLAQLQVASMPSTWLLAALLFGSCCLGVLVGLLSGAPLAINKR